MRVLLLLLVFWAHGAWAFPELIRHGYAQCTTCHVSPTGGGVLTQYGRQLSAEVLSTWSSPGEEQFLHSPVGQKLADKGILVGGDVRGIATHYKDPNQEENKQFFMMADIEGAYQTDHFTGVISIGRINNAGDGGIHGDFDSTEYYGLIKFTDEFNIRAGRFSPAYGINVPDHTVVTRQMLGGVWPRHEFDTVEGSYLSEHWTVIGTAAQSAPGSRVTSQETVRSLNVSYNLLNSMRVGGSYWEGRGPKLDRHMYGPNAILGFTSRFYNMTEIDFDQQSGHNGTFGFTQLAYEVHKGVTPYLQYQREQTNNSDSSTLAQTYGVGVHFYPRPHVEISGELDRIHSYALWSDMAYLLAHYYF
jgi:hypothetical protein